MTTYYVYGYDTSQLKLDLQELSFGKLASQSSTQFVIKGLGLFESDNLTFNGSFTTSNGAITGGTITDLQVSGTSSFGQSGLKLDIPGLSIAVTSDGYNLSFNLGTVLTSGSTYYEKSSGSFMVGLGNDTFYGGYNTFFNPGGGYNTIYASGGAEQINLKGSSSTDVFLSGSNGGLTIIDMISSTSAASDTIVGSARILFEGDDTFVQDTNGILTLTKTAAQAAGYTGAGSIDIAVSDSAANVAADLDGLQTLYAAGRLASISLTDSGIPDLSITAAQLSADAGVLGSFGGYMLDVSGLAATAAIQLVASHHYTIGKLGISDSGDNVLASLDKLELLADAGELGSISLTGGSPVLALTPAQTVADGHALAAITGGAAFTVDAGTTSQTIDGVSGHATTVIFAGASSQYTVTSSGGTITVTQGSVVDHLTNVTALQFSDLTDIVASQTPGTANGVSSFQVATLYSAVLARTPDPAGLAFYETYAANNPTVPITTYAEWFLQSPEYSAKHSYTQTSAGDSQFITDTYQNLLHRLPDMGGVDFYLTKVIQPMLQNVTPGTSAYTTAELAAHAQVLAYFSQSPEFQGDVQVTAQNSSSAQHWLVLT